MYVVDLLLTFTQCIIFSLLLVKILIQMNKLCYNGFLQILILERLSISIHNASIRFWEEGNRIHFESLETLALANSSLERLYRTADLQNDTITIVDEIGMTLSDLEVLLALGEEALNRAMASVPFALSEACRVLEIVLSLSVDDLNLNGRREQLDELEEEVESAMMSVDELSNTFEDLQNEVFSLNSSIAELLVTSEQLDVEAALLLERSQDALLLAIDSTAEGNAVIAEAEYLLEQLQDRLLDVDPLLDGLSDVVAVVEQAEELSEAAAMEADRLAMELGQLAADINTAVLLLEQASSSLSESLRVSASYPSPVYCVVPQAILC